MQNLMSDWGDEAVIYRNLLITDNNDIHFGVGIPGNKRLGLVPRAPKEGQALDVGCGSGENLIALSRLGYACTGVDPSGQQVEYARESLNMSGIPGQVMRLGAEELDLLEGSFDLILTVGVLHFCRDLERIISLMAAKLKLAAESYCPFHTRST
jgi:2-polyprenyl-3-methyl-5-hydroxy-6-metoxy-1,4-benzoquinol methylase